VENNTKHEENTCYTGLDSKRKPSGHKSEESWLEKGLISEPSAKRSKDLLKPNRDQL
jgi:hypothetical protein